MRPSERVYRDMGRCSRARPTQARAGLPLVHLQSSPVLIHGALVLELCTHSAEPNPLAGPCPAPGPVAYDCVAQAALSVLAILHAIVVVPVI